MSVRWSARGETRLYEHVARIAQDDPAAAERWLKKIEKIALDSLEIDVTPPFIIVAERRNDQLRVRELR